MKICKIVTTAMSYEMVKEIDKSFKNGWELVGPVQFMRLIGYTDDQYTATLVKEKQ